MIIRILVKIGEKILGMGVKDDEPRADMFLPDWLLAFGMVLIVGGLGFGIFAAVTFNIIMFAIAVCALLLGVVAVMCWKNQTGSSLKKNLNIRHFWGIQKVFGLMKYVG